VETVFYRDGKPNRSMANRCIKSLIRKKWIDTSNHITQAGTKVLKPDDSD
jgi:hypothetical protein